MIDKILFLATNSLAIALFMLISLILMDVLPVQQFIFSSSVLILGTVLSQLASLGGGYFIPRACHSRAIDSHSLVTHYIRWTFSITISSCFLIVLAPSLTTYTLLFGSILSMHYLIDTYSKIKLPLMFIAKLNLFSNLFLAVVVVLLYLNDLLSGESFVIAVSTSKLVFISMSSIKLNLLLKMSSSANNIVSPKSLKVALSSFCIYLLGAFDVAILSYLDTTPNREQYLLTKHFSYGVYTAIFIEIYLPFVLSSFSNKKFNNDILIKTAFISIALFVCIVLIGTAITIYKNYPFDLINIVGIASGMSLYGLITCLNLVLFTYFGKTTSSTLILVLAFIVFIIASYNNLSVHSLIFTWNAMLLVILFSLLIRYNRFSSGINASSHLKWNLL